MSARRRALLGAAVLPWLGCTPSLASLIPASPDAELIALCNRHPALIDDFNACGEDSGLGDAATDAWCDAQLAVTADLAEAPAGDLVDLEAKLAAGLYWFGTSGPPSSMTGEEADLLRSCLVDLRAIMGGGA